MKIGLIFLLTSCLMPAASMTCFSGSTLLSSNPQVTCGPLALGFSDGHVINFPDGNAVDVTGWFQLRSVTLENAGASDQYVQVTVYIDTTGFQSLRPSQMDLLAAHRRFTGSTETGPITSAERLLLNFAPQSVGLTGFNFSLGGWNGGRVGFPASVYGVSPNGFPPPFLQLAICNSPQGPWISCAGPALAFAESAGGSPIQAPEAVQVSADDSSYGVEQFFITLDDPEADSVTVPLRTGRAIAFGGGLVAFNLRPTVSTPEPAGWLLVASGIAWLAGSRRKQT